VPYNLGLSTFTTAYPATPLVKLADIVVNVFDLGANFAAINVSADLQVSVSCPTATLTGTLEVL
jgi:hypothetical protein